MKNSLSGLLVGGLMLLVGAVPMFAHHGLAIYDLTKLSTVTGTVSAFEFKNPHVHVLLDVRGSKGNLEKWVAESVSPNMLVREGWDKNTLKPGDQIIATGHPARNGTNVILIEKVVLSNGRTLTLEAPEN